MTFKIEKNTCPMNEIMHKEKTINIKYTFNML